VASGHPFATTIISTTFGCFRPDPGFPARDEKAGELLGNGKFQKPHVYIITHRAVPIKCELFGMRTTIRGLRQMQRLDFLKKRKVCSSAYHHGATFGNK